MDGKAKVAILLPTYNEEDGIGRVIEEIAKVRQEGWALFVVDSCSTDKTVEIAKAKGAKVISINKRGKGLAVREAFSSIDADFLVLLDSDMSYMAYDIPSILEKLGECDVVLGSRFRGSIEKGSMDGINRLGNILLTTGASALYFSRVSDVCTGMWGFTKKAYKGMEIDAPHFELEANFFAEAVKKKFRLCEIPISYKCRAGVAKLSPIHGLSIGFYLIKKRFSK